jgi:hypothetical protein
MKAASAITPPVEVSDNLKHPTYYLLELGERIYRFASSGSKSVFGYQASRWWLREREFNMLCERSKRGRLGLGLQARFDLSVLQSWGNRMDVLVKATVRRKVEAWMGCPKTQRETAPNGISIKMPGCQDIQQVFIPGITDASGMLTYYGRTALSVEESPLLNTPQLWAEKR